MLPRGSTGIMLLKNTTVLSAYERIGPGQYKISNYTEFQ